MDLWRVTEDGVKRAIEECDNLGKETFLDNYGYGPAKRYHLEYEGRKYDSKAIVGVAYGYDCPQRGPLKRGDFSGGVAAYGPVARLLELGFKVWDSESGSYF